MDNGFDRTITRKAMAYDLIHIFKEKDTYTPEEIEKLIDAYIKSADQK